MRTATREILEDIDGRALIFVWAMSLAATALLVVTNAPSPVVALVLAGVGVLAASLVPRDGIRAVRDRTRAERRGDRVVLDAAMRRPSVLSRRLILSAVRQLPASERRRWQEEWLGELVALSGRRVTALAWGLGVRLAARALAEELRDEAHRKTAERGQADVVGLRVRDHTLRDSP